MSACTQVVQFTRLHLRPLQMWLRTAYPPALHFLDRLVRLPPPVQESFYSWESPHNVCKGVPFAWPSSTSSVVTDASLLDWEVHLDSFEAIESVVGSGSLVPHCVGASGHPQCVLCLPGPYQAFSGSHTNQQ